MISYSRTSFQLNLDLFRFCIVIASSQSDPLLIEVRKNPARRRAAVSPGFACRFMSAERAGTLLDSFPFLVGFVLIVFP